MFEDVWMIKHRDSLPSLNKSNKCLTSKHMIRGRIHETSSNMGGLIDHIDPKQLNISDKISRMSQHSGPTTKPIHLGHSHGTARPQAFLCQWLFEPMMPEISWMSPGVDSLTVPIVHGHPGPQLETQSDATDATWSRFDVICTACVPRGVISWFKTH